MHHSPMILLTVSTGLMLDLDLFIVMPKNCGVPSATSSAWHLAESRVQTWAGYLSTGSNAALASFSMSFPNGMGVDLEALLAIAMKKERQIHI
jgi:hypothetical protein